MCFLSFRPSLCSYMKLIFLELSPSAPQAVTRAWTLPYLFIGLIHGTECRTEKQITPCALYLCCLPFTRHLQTASLSVWERSHDADDQVSTDSVRSLWKPFYAGLGRFISFFIYRRFCEERNIQQQQNTTNKAYERYSPSLCVRETKREEEENRKSRGCWKMKHYKITKYFSEEKFTKSLPKKVNEMICKNKTTQRKQM